MNPRLNKKGDRNDNDDNSDKELARRVKGVNTVFDVTRGEEKELQVQTKFNNGDVNEYPPFDKKEYEIKEWTKELSFHPEGKMTSCGGIK